MKRSSPPPGAEPMLFDLPLRDPDPGEGEELEPAPRTRVSSAPAPAVGAVDPMNLPLFADASTAGAPVAPGEWIPAPWGRRLGAAAIDLGVHAAVGLALVAGSSLLGLRPSEIAWTPVALFLLAFSFLYAVVPLSFWGQTPGMVSLGLVAHGAKSQPLTFSQTCWRWLGSVLTLLGLGLPALLGLTGRSLADRLSRSSVQAGTAFHGRAERAAA